ncbi:GtrA family protein [Lactococcus insecticola]|uniref:Sugar translocase n=1 Tax=Pseudolactococcus insecticola TaxID=2709158 RepID=A0A6A0BA65_9LACT|nr:GtrA family protein [Lactococcus insecticola]GFH40717.1 sugar translocase [Lactococcus insecticola]
MKHTRFQLKKVQKEILRYLIVGATTTLIYLLVRLIVFAIFENGSLSAVIANVVAILFAFVANDVWVFPQENQDRLKRFVKFLLARLATFALDVGLSFCFVDKYPEILGQLFQINKSQINLIVTLVSQVLIIILNYVFAKLFVFTKKAS